MNYTKKLVLCALFVALSFVGANIKIFGTIAFDSMPAFLATLALGFPAGAAVGFLGHMLTAMTSGFPYGLPIHLIIAVFMAVTMFVFYAVYNAMARIGFNNIIVLVVACLIAAVVNGPVQLVALIPFLGFEACMALMAPLFTVALANCVLGAIVYEALVKAKVLSTRKANANL